MPEKVLFLLDSLSPGGGAEKIAVDIAITLKSSGKYIPIFCSTRFGGSMENLLKDSRIEYYVIKRKRFYDIIKFYRIFRIIKKQNIKIIHSHKLGSNFWGGLIGWIAGVSIIIAHKHGQVYNNWINLLLDKIVSKLSNKIIFVSDYERTLFLNAIGAAPEKCITIHNGINIYVPKVDSIDDRRKRYGIKESGSVVGMMARFSKEKDHGTFLLAAREVLKSDSHVTFLLAGEGSTKKEMENFSDVLGISGSIIFTGFVENTSNVISLLDVGCLSSTQEGLGIVLLEYMAYAIPIVATNVGGIPEVVKDGVNGFLVEPGDYRAMAKRISELLNDIKLRSQMGRNGFSILEQNFTQELMIEKIENLYFDLMHQELTNSHK